MVLINNKRIAVMVRSMRNVSLTIQGRSIAGLVSLLCILMPSVALGGAVLTLNQINIERFPEIRIYITAADERGTPLKGLTVSNFIVQEDGATAQVKGVLPLERGEAGVSRGFQASSLPGARRRILRMAEAERPAQTAALHYDAERTAFRLCRPVGDVVRAARGEVG